jgi:hypothetical protein
MYRLTLSTRSGRTVSQCCRWFPEDCGVPPAPRHRPGVFRKILYSGWLQAPICIKISLLKNLNLKILKRKNLGPALKGLPAGSRDD